MLNQRDIIFISVFSPLALVVIISVCIIICCLRIRRRKKQLHVSKRDKDLHVESQEIEQLPLVSVRSLKDENKGATVTDDTCDENQELTTDTTTGQTTDSNVDEQSGSCIIKIETENTQYLAEGHSAEGLANNTDKVVTEIEDKNTINEKTDSITERRHDSYDNSQSDTCIINIETKEEIETCTIEFTTPKGNRNLGNTCFFNSSLQALFVTKYLKEELSDFKERLNNTKDNLRNSALTLRFLELLDSHSKPSGDHTNSLKGVLRAVSKKNNQFGRGTQEDSFELLNTILEGISTETENNDLPVEDWNCMEKNDSDTRNGPVTKLFTGLFLTVYVYDSCDDVEVEFESFTTLSIQIADNFPAQITERLELRTLTETASENGIEIGLSILTQAEDFPESDLPCRVCNTAGNGCVYRRMLILVPPPVLVIHIDRFQKDDYGRLNKNCDCVTYPRVLSMSQFCSVASMKYSSEIPLPLKYEIYAIVIHEGGISGGHYYAYVNTTRSHNVERWKKILRRDLNKIEDCKSEIELFLKEEHFMRHNFQNSKNDSTCHQGNWFYVSDTHVESVDEKDVLSKRNAYILFYEMQ